MINGWSIPAIAFAVVQVQQQVIVDDIKEMKSTDKEMRDMINRIYEIMRSWEE